MKGIEEITIPSNYLLRYSTAINGKEKKAIVTDLAVVNSHHFGKYMKYWTSVPSKTELWLGSIEIYFLYRECLIELILERIMELDRLLI